MHLPNKTVELVNLWAQFEARYPDGSIEDFCRYTLIHQREGRQTGEMMAGVIPAVPNAVLLKLMGRIHKINAAYGSAALEGTGLHQLEEMGMLLSIYQLKTPRKTEVIYTNLMELSSGTDMLNRLRQRGYISETADKEDKRSKRLRLTPAGLAVIDRAAARLEKMARMMTKDMPTEDQQLCIQLLRNMEIKLAARWVQDKGRPFDEVYKELA
ncbi:MarR family winged helix-turn-helix transcriptional regulator [Dinghuibacter silviterrae]|uniref:DNA-binding MarR family transcriptional regulator n=1 Tax=Dinghuibacter silviterrae TaxID=1539049 RepID=A0A4R8DJP3_9BACT|nr:MarR family winged helix-turn-helix transcriptional regulator [Dinghuibacter silviterrae]TDW97220.1 DNA-binding MarR family transcriptional regulator [Dinghuibacter silviterrae]